MEIREDILKSINNTEVLKLEHQHVNTLIQQNEADFTKTIQWFMGISMASIGAILSSISGFSMNLIEEGKKYSVDGIKKQQFHLFLIPCSMQALYRLLYLLLFCFLQFDNVNNLLPIKKKLFKNNFQNIVVLNKLERINEYGT